MSSRLSAYIRQHHVGFVAIFLALVGGAYALPGKNKVDSGDIKAKNVKRGDLATNAVTNPKLADNAVGSAEVIANGLTGADVDESSLGEVPGAANAALLDGVDSSDFLRRGAGSVGAADLATLPAARAFNDSILDVPNNTPTDLALNSERFDTANLHNTSENTARLTAPIAGTYAVTGHVQWSPNSTGFRNISIERNDTTVIAMDQAPPAGTSSTIQSIPTVTRLSAGDFVTLEVQQNSGGNLSVLPPSAGFEGTAELAMAWIGP